MATGPSVELLTRAQLNAVHQDVCVIAVNGAHDWLPRANVWSTIDLSKRNRDRIAVARPGVTYYGCAPKDYGSPEAVNPAHRKPQEPHLVCLRPLGPKMVAGVRYPLAEDPGHCTLGNSTYGAVNVAYHMRPKRIAILGLDGKGGYAHAQGKPGSLGHLHGLFIMARAQLADAGIELVVGNPHSLVRCFPTLAPAETLNWIQQGLKGDA